MRRIAVCISYEDNYLRECIAERAAELGFQADFYEFPEEIGLRIYGYEIIYGHPSVDIVRKAQNLKWLCSDFAGIENYLAPDVFADPACLLSNSSGAYGPTISEHIIMVLLMLLRRMPEYEADMRSHKWSYYTPIRSIIGGHFVLLGTGDIGSNTARRLKALGALKITGVCRSGVSSESAFDRVVALDKLDEVLPKADALIMSLPATKETKGIMTRERIALLREDAYLINVGRGSAIDQDALAEALMKRSIAGAALDVMTPEPLGWESSLWDCPNTILTPHVSGNLSLDLTRDLDVHLFLEDLERYSEGKPLKNLVDRTRGY